MPGVQSEGAAVGVGSPVRKNRLSLKFLQRKETKRALDFTEPQAEESNTAEPAEATSCDQVVPAPCPSSLPCEKRENLVPFVGLNNLGNTCYLNSILQVLYYCPGFKDAVKSLCQLSKSKDKPKEEDTKNAEGEASEVSMPVHMELLHSLQSLISSVEQLQSTFLFNPDKYNEGELATPPRRVLNTLRQLNPMYEGYLQHDAQEVLQCILAYIQEACDTIKKDLGTNQAEKPGECEHITKGTTTLTQEEEESSDGQLSGKRKSDTEVGNAKKKPKSQGKPKKTEEECRPFTRSKRKSSGDMAGNPVSAQPDVAEKDNKEKETESNTEEEKTEGTAKDSNKRKKRVKLNWLKPSGKQPSIFSKFRSMGRISSHVGDRAESKDQDKSHSDPQGKATSESEKTIQNQTGTGREELQGLDMLKQLFQGQLVLRTRCLECECYTERREDFQDISVPVQEEETSCSEASSEISPDPKPEQKTLRWAISQFASVERIVGQDKYFCETCHHYTEAERSLLFDKTPEVVTIHLKCFAASGSEMDPYAGLSKVNTPLLTPLKLSLDEWTTRPSGGHQEHHYGLFAVVMHSGVTISSGHYTTYIRMTELHRTHLDPRSQEESQKEEDDETKPLKTEEVPPPDYDDGEVSFSLNSKVKNMADGTSLPGKAGGKRSTEGVGLLGGQRSISNYEISASKQVASEKPANVPTYIGSSVQNGVVKKEKEEEGEGVKEESQVSSDMALQNLLDYEGKWMLFDDSEVRLFEEEEFLRACSPETCSTSTPYLLFYRKVSGEIR
ncbi:ubiquitin carboxyl-terminal hydrolase 1 isoform X2 [Clarias gariepinus]|uniref:ubiquitin carboxyl-terminal hydrolase 1 isoform X2 n=1 Tax=Clarias gariepinus TaxID=13013 RepID=UPI00234E2337|nr:ubiquitin carboxyl-terminal hydrolase 1 isoform X2 [Clarias gariepinus]